MEVIERSLIGHYAKLTTDEAADRVIIHDKNGVAVYDGPTASCPVQPDNNGTWEPNMDRIEVRLQEPEVQVLADGDPERFAHYFLVCPPISAEMAARVMRGEIELLPDTPN